MIFNISKAGMKFTYTEFMTMPVRKLLKFHDIAIEYFNQKNKQTEE